MAPPDSAARSAIAAAARQYIGTPFRLYGRNPEFGLDCVGLVLAAFRSAGLPIIEISGYQLRNLTIVPFAQLASKLGLRQSSDNIGIGDIVLSKPSPAQHHLMIAEHEHSVIHAHAGLRRVVQTPMPIHINIDRVWRFSPHQSEGSS